MHTYPGHTFPKTETWRCHLWEPTQNIEKAPAGWGYMTVYVWPRYLIGFKSQTYQTYLKNPNGDPYCWKLWGLKKSFLITGFLHKVVPGWTPPKKRSIVGFEGYNPKNPGPYRKIVGLMVKTSHPQHEDCRVNPETSEHYKTVMFAQGKLMSPSVSLDNLEAPEPPRTSASNMELEGIALGENNGWRLWNGWSSRRFLRTFKPVTKIHR